MSYVCALTGPPILRPMAANAMSDWSTWIPTTLRFAVGAMSATARPSRAFSDPDRCSSESGARISAKSLSPISAASVAATSTCSNPRTTATCCPNCYRSSARRMRSSNMRSARRPVRCRPARIGKVLPSMNSHCRHPKPSDGLPTYSALPTLQGAHSVVWLGPSGTPDSLLSTLSSNTVDGRRFESKTSARCRTGVLSQGPSTRKLHRRGQKGLRLLRPGNFDRTGYLLWEPSKTVCLLERWLKDASDFIIQEGDVLINLTAQSLDDRFMGRTCLARAGDTSLLNQRIGRFRGWSDRVLPEYVFRVLQSSGFQRHVTGMCEGSKVKHLFWSHIGRFATRVPPIREQRSNVRILQSLDNLLHGTTQRVEEQRLLHSRCLSALDQPSGLIK